MIKNVFAASITASIALAALAGCGDSAPNDADIRAAMSRQIEMVGGKAAVEDQRGELAKVKVIKCVKAELGGFTCEIESLGNRVSGRFKKESEGWVFAGPAG